MQILGVIALGLFLVLLYYGWQVIQWAIHIAAAMLDWGFHHPLHVAVGAFCVLVVIYTTEVISTWGTTKKILKDGPPGPS